jgi:energy-coupling factor transporter ATP-binding protein EcfA2
MAIRIPTRFEMVLNSSKFDPTPLIIGVDSDLKALERVRRTIEVQNAGALAFIYGRSGAGKTTSVYSLTSLISQKYEPVFLVPATVPLRELGDWLATNLPPRATKTLPILVDNREITDDAVGLRQLMSSLNAITRARPDAMVLWPTTDPEWRKALREVARNVGGRSLVPDDSDIEIVGPAPEEWPRVLERLLVQLDQSIDELALSDETVRQASERATAVGGFLELIRDQIAARLDGVQEAKALPQILFVVTSDTAVVGEANRIRRALKLNLKADELLAYSPRSGAGKYWKARLSDPNHHLAYITTLFNARLVTMGPSAVTHSMLEKGEDALREVALTAGVVKNGGNAERTFKSTDLYKFLTASTEFELTSGSKGGLSPEMRIAYAGIQSMSSKRHKAINQAICAYAQEKVPEFRADLGRFEVDLGSANAFADAVISNGDVEYHLEFHHLSEKQCTASSMSSYIMEKLQTYAIHYNLIPR